MEELHSKTQKASKNYLSKYNDLINMINGYQQTDKHVDMKKVKGIIHKILKIFNLKIVKNDFFLFMEI